MGGDDGGMVVPTGTWVVPTFEWDGRSGAAMRWWWGGGGYRWVVEVVVVVLPPPLT